MVANIDELVDMQKAVIHPVSLSITAAKKISLSVLRLDKIHAIISGNKWFKLKYSLQQAIDEKKNRLVTAGGAYSNHIAATAWCCMQLGLNATGIIRGERPTVLSPTLQDAISYGMELQFVSREAFRNKQALYHQLNEQYKNACLVEEGGQNENGVKGAAEILNHVPGTYSHVCCAIGTGTMLSGLVRSSKPGQELIGISSLKISGRDNELEQFIRSATGEKSNYNILYEYHFGGYAKKTGRLIDFMNAFFAETGIPTDFVYTSRLFYGVSDLIKRDFFKPGSNILVIHSGGLQGNRSLSTGLLAY